jgi:hypothetical protein
MARTFHNNVISVETFAQSVEKLAAFLALVTRKSLTFRPSDYFLVGKGGLAVVVCLL